MNKVQKVVTAVGGVVATAGTQVHAAVTLIPDMGSITGDSTADALLNRSSAAMNTGIEGVLGLVAAGVGIFILGAAAAHFRNRRTATQV